MPEVAIGFGCERGIRSDAVETGIRNFLREHSRSISDLQTIATIELKRDEDGLLKAADNLQVKLHFYSSDDLSTVDNVPNPSQVVEDCVGTPGVAEPAALLVSGSEKLVVEKTVLRPMDRALTLTMADMNSGGDSNE